MNDVFALHASRAFVTSLLFASLLHCSGDDTAQPGDADAAAADAASPDARAVADASLPSSDAAHPDGAGGGGLDDAQAVDARPPVDASDANAMTDAGSDARATADSGADASDASPVGCAFGDTSDGAAHLLGVFTLQPMSIKVMVPYLTPSDLSAAITNGATTVDDPGPGSGLEYAGGCTFYAIGDRGINVDHGKGNAKAFPLPAYTPTIMKLDLDPSSGSLLVDGVVNIVNENGAPVTGISNDPNDDVPYLTATATTPLPYNQDGLDTEDVRRLPSGDLAFSEEYSPSIGIVDGVTGKVKVRYVPSNVALPNAHYPVKAILPPVFTNRRDNKGFEGLALSADGKTAYAVLQAPMGDETAYGASLVNRVVRVEHFDDPSDAVVTGHYVVLHASGVTSFGGAAQPKVFFNSATWLAPDQLLLLERAPGHLHLVVADLSHATNLVGQPALGEGTLDPESVAAGKGYAALGITPAVTNVVFDSDDTPSFITTPANGAIAPDKLEGLAVINPTTVAISNDNDFGISNASDRARIWILRLKAPIGI